MAFLTTWYAQAGVAERGWPFMEATLVFMTLTFLFELYLDVRQHKTYSLDSVPAKLLEVVGRIDKDTAQQPKAKAAEASGGDGDGVETADKQDDKEPESLLDSIKSKHKKSQAYGLDKSVFGLVQSIYGQTEATAFLLLGFMPYVWDLSARILETKFGMPAAENEIWWVRSFAHAREAPARGSRVTRAATACAPLTLPW